MGMLKQSLHEALGAARAVGAAAPRTARHDTGAAQALVVRLHVHGARGCALLGSRVSLFVVVLLCR